MKYTSEIANTLMQAEMIAEILKSKPEYFVFVSHESSWLPRPDSDYSVVEWFIKYKQEHLEPVGLIETLPDGRIESQWSGAMNPRPQSWWIQIYRAK